MLLEDQRVGMVLHQELNDPSMMIIVFGAQKIVGDDAEQDSQGEESVSSRPESSSERVGRRDFVHLCVLSIGSCFLT